MSTPVLLFVLLLLSSALSFFRQVAPRPVRRGSSLSSSSAEEELLLSRYDGEAIDRYYRSRLLDVWERGVEIGSPILGWWILRRWDNITAPFRDERENKRRKQLRAEDLKDAIVQGRSITLIKSGQALSLRPDLLKSADYVRELSKLHDEVGTFPTNVALDIIRSELGRDPNEIYAFDPPDPIASASIGQVFRARILATNQTVAIKVQRPNARITAPIDMFIIRRIAAFVKQQKKLQSNLLAIADEFGAQLWEELNYVQEGKNCAQFKALYEEIPGIYVPSVNFDLTTRRVLTMEFVNGVKGPWLRGGERMLTIGLQCSVLQLLGKGYFHSDPHRGNLLRTENDELAYLDFGMMCQVPAERRFALIGTVLGLVNKDIPLVIENLKTLELLPTDTDTTAVVSALNVAVMNATLDGQSGSTLNFTQLNSNLENISNAGLLPFSLPPFYTLIIRTLTILEGLALSVDPSFRLIRGAYPFIAKQILENPQEEMKGLLKSVMISPETGRIRWDRLEQFISISSNADKAIQGDFSALKKAQSRSDLIKKYAGGDANQDQADVSYDTALSILTFLLSENGGFLREPLLDELVDTLDAIGLTAASLTSYLSNGLFPSPKTKPNRETVERFLMLLRNLADASAERRVAETGSIAAVPDPLGVLGSIASTLLSSISAPVDSPQRQKLQAVLSKGAQIVSLLLGKLTERNVRRLVTQFVSPKNVETVFPLITRLLDLTSRT